MPILAALAAGVLFGIGLTIAQMTNPKKVLDFLDVAGMRTGAWDPTLLMVFIGALPTMFAAYALHRRMHRPLWQPAFIVPRPGALDARLIAGSAVFGIGWGLAGICPGPALTSLAPVGGALGGIALFIASMMGGIMLSWLFAPASVEPVTPATEPRT